MQNDAIAEKQVNHPGKKRRNRVTLGAAGALLIVILSLGAYVLYEVAQSNFHTVAPGQVYRSSRMNPDSLARTIQSHQIKSVLSLIGPSLVESNAVRQSGAMYYDISISDRHAVTDQSMDEIVTILRAAPKPLLIHCKAGADRTGLAASLYHYAIEGQPADQADDSLTLLYGHLPPWLGFASRAMDESFWRYAASHLPGCGTNQLN
jgi:protein tyrosine/serine phosphatase